MSEKVVDMKTTGMKVIFLIIGLFIFKISVADTVRLNQNQKTSSVRIGK